MIDVGEGGKDGCFFFFFNDTATTEIYTLSLHDALPICYPENTAGFEDTTLTICAGDNQDQDPQWQTRNVADRKSTRLNSSH